MRKHVLVAAGIVCLLVVFGAAPARGGWSSLELPYPVSAPEGIWGSSARDVFCVEGDIFRFDGTAWDVMERPGIQPLHAVWGAAGNDVFAVGDKGEIVHYDGAAWSLISAPATYSLVSVWGSSGTNVFAGGHTPSWDAGGILHYDGTSWTEMAAPPSLGISAIWGSSATDVFAAAEGLACDPLGTEEDCWTIANILHYDGKSWSLVPLPEEINNTFVNGMWGSSGQDVFAVGLDVLHFDGVTWSRMPVPAFAGFESAELRGVWGSSPTDVFAVGLGTETDFELGGTRDVPLIVHYDGARWSKMTNPTTNGYGYSSVWGSSATDVYAVGSENSRYDGKSLSVTMPNGGQKWRRGSLHKIKWAGKAAGGKVAIALFQDGVLKKKLFRAVPNSGSALWRVPPTLKPGASYKIRVLHRQDPTLVDFTDTYFKIY